MSTSNESIAKVSKDLAKLKSSIRRDATLLFAVAFLLFAVFLGYFYFGYTEFKKISEPKLLMDAAETIVTDNIKVAREHLESEVSQNAELWAQQLSDQAVATVGDMRVELEKFVESQIKEQIAESVRLADPEFEKIMAENNEVMKKAFQDFAKNQKNLDELVDVIAVEVDNRLQTNLQADAGEVLNMMGNLKDKLVRLREGKNLKPEEMLEQQILKTARLIQQKQVD